MDRYAIFVDAEYLYAEGGMLCCNSPERQEILLYGLGANDFLVGLATDACELQPLRTYWYDTSADGVPTSAQQLVATLPNMKLRLERSGTPEQQAPLSATMRRDLTTLARQRAICDAFLLSADEDLIESVREGPGPGTASDPHQYCIPRRAQGTGPPAWQTRLTK